MTYYEELGISADAAEEDIRHAHRRLVKLLHPDQQQDDQLRRLADLQLMRVNALVEQLLDPSQRKLYDLTLRHCPAPAPPADRRPAAAAHAILKGWKFAAAGVAVAVVAGMFSASSPTDVVRSVTAGTASAAPAAAPVMQPRAKGGRAAAVPALPARIPAPIAKAQSDPPAPVSAQKPQAFDEPISPALAESKPPAVEAQAASNGAQASAPPTLGGVWLYAGGRRTGNDEGLYKPEYIELRIAEESGQVHGEYRSRYAVTDLPISPAVNFTFQGSAASAATLSWKGPKGSSGTVILKLLNRNAMQVDWKVSDAGDSGIGLQFGTAVLLRRL